MIEDMFMIRYLEDIQEEMSGEQKTSGSGVEKEAPLKL